GRSGGVETTALAAIALTRGGQNPGLTRGALAWLALQRDAGGTWYSTQATVLALKALLAGTDSQADRERRIEIALGNGFKKTVVIPPDQAEVMQQLDLSEHLAGGANRLTLTETTGTAAGYQVAFRYHVAGAEPVKAEGLSIKLEYSKTEVAVADTVTATATVVNNTKQAAPMVMLD